MTIADGPEVITPTRVIEERVSQIHHRLRIQAVMNALNRVLPAVCAAGGGAAVLRVLGPAPSTTVILCVLGAALAATWAFAARRSPTMLAAALRLDEALDRRGQLAAAYDLSRPPGPTDGYVRLLAARETLALQGLPTSNPIPLRWPAHWPLSGLCLLALAASITLPESSATPRAAANITSQPPETTEKPTPILGTGEAALLRQEAEEALARAQSEEGKAVWQELIALTEKLEAGQLSREAAQRQAARLLADAERTEQGDGALRQKLQERGAALSQAKLGEQLGQALAKQDLEDAAEALRTLAERLNNRKKPLSGKELEELRQAIQEAQKKKAAEEKGSNQGSNSQENRTREQLTEKHRRLLEKKQAGTASDEELAELEQSERQLEHLDRRTKQQEQALSDLDRALAEAAREIQELKDKAQGKTQDKERGDKPEGTKEGKDQGAGKDAFEQAARSLSEEASRSMTDEEKKELLEQLKRLKERLRQAEQDGQLKERLEEFERQARGAQGSGQPGQPGQGKGSGPAQMGSASGPGTTGAGKSPASDNGQLLPGGGGKEPGHSHDPNLTGEAGPRLETQAEDAVAAAQDTGEGASESETIRTAAEEGFRAATYQHLYTEYKTVLEETMADESIPAGQRRSVKRYFELIRPRENDQP